MAEPAEVINSATALGAVVWRVLARCDAVKGAHALHLEPCLRSLQACKTRVLNELKGVSSRDIGQQYQDALGERC